MKDFKVKAITQDNIYNCNKLYDIPQNFFDIVNMPYFNDTVNKDCSNFIIYAIGNAEPIIIDYFMWYNTYIEVLDYDKTHKAPDYLRRNIRRINNICQKLQLTFLREFYFSL